MSEEVQWKSFSEREYCLAWLFFPMNTISLKNLLGSDRSTKTCLYLGVNKLRISKNKFWGAPKSLWMVIAAMKLKDACSLEGKL